MTENLFNSVVESLLSKRDKNGNQLNMSSLIVTDNIRTYTHYFGEREAIDVRSIAKPILCMAVGAAIANGLKFDGDPITLDTYVWKYLKKYAVFYNDKQETEWKKVRLIDLFRITLGHDKGIVFSSDVKKVGEEDLVNYVVNYPIVHKVGEHFVYSNAGGFIMSSLITEYCGMSAAQLVDKYIFSKLDITNYTWRNYGKYCAGCTGLKLYNEDLHKLAKLIYENGLYNGVQIVPSDWIELMRTPQVPAPTHRYISDRAFPKWSYGLNLWLCEDGNYYCDGTDGQYMIIIPQKGIVITSTGHQSDTTPVSESFGLFK